MTLDILLILLVILIAIYAGCIHISLIRFKTATLEMLNEMQELENKAFEHQLQLIKSFVYKDENNKRED
jgi:sensor domain CHASE-containing protein